MLITPERPDLPSSQKDRTSSSKFHQNTATCTCSNNNNNNNNNNDNYNFNSSSISTTATTRTTQQKTIIMNTNSTCNDQSTTPTTPRSCDSSDLQLQNKHHHNNLHSPDNTDNNTMTATTCTSGLACLNLNDNLNSKLYSPTSQHKGQHQNMTIINPTLSHLNNFSSSGATTTKSKSPRFVKRALFLKDDNNDEDNEVFHQDAMMTHSHSTPRNINNTTTDLPSTPTSPFSSSSSSPPRCPSLNLGGDLENKQLLISGRLYLIRQIGNASQTSGSPSSPSRSFTKPFSFSSIGLSSPTSSPPSQHPHNVKRKLPIYVRVYKCNKDHFALISRDSSYSSRHIYLNMRHCRVIPGSPIGRFIVAGNSDSGSLMEFETPELASLEGWLDALQTQTPPESPIRSGISSGAAGTGGNSKSGGNSSSGSPSLPKSPVLPTLAETDED